MSCASLVVLLPDFLLWKSASRPLYRRTMSYRFSTSQPSVRRCTVKIARMWFCASSRLFSRRSCSASVFSFFDLFVFEFVMMTLRSWKCSLT